MAKKTFVREIEEYVELHRCQRTGIAWVENGKTGCGHSAHPNIDATGSVKGMKSRGYWRDKDRTVRSHGFIYNIDSLIVSDELDKVAAEACQCEACRERREYEAEHLKVKVGDLVEGDGVDLAKGPYLKDHPMAEFEYAQVVEVVDEGATIAVGYEGIDVVGYDKDDEVWIKADASDVRRQKLGTC